jgi:hypothetical protein
MPEHKEDRMNHTAVAAGLKTKPPAKKAPAKHLKSFHVKEQSDGKYHVVKHSGHPAEPPVEHSADSLSDVQAALEDHMGAPNEGEAEAEQGPAPQPPAPEAEEQ